MSQPWFCRHVYITSFYPIPGILLQGVDKVSTFLWFPLALDKITRRETLTMVQKLGDQQKLDTSYKQSLFYLVSSKTLTSLCIYHFRSKILRYMKVCTWTTIHEINVYRIKSWSLQMQSECVMGLCKSLWIF